MNNNEDNKIVYLRIDDILPNRFQPREVFDETGLEELADSIKEHGVIQPIIVRQMGNKYELIAGERRTKASALAGLTTIPAIVKNMDDKESAKVSLLENLQRRNLSPIEEARTYKRIIELDNMTQEDLAKTMGKSQPMVANKLRLLALPEEVQDALMKNQISERHARSLLSVKDKKTQLMLLDRIKNERLTVRELDAEIKNLGKQQGIVDDPGMKQVSSNPNNFNTPNPSNFNDNLPNSMPMSNQENLSNSFDNFNNPSQGNNQSSSMYNNFGGFNNMGLNDYRSVSSGPVNNMPNNFSNMSYGNDDGNTNSFNNNLSNFNDNNNLNDTNSSPDSVNSFLNEKENNQSQNNNMNMGLGSMFDGAQTPSSSNVPSYTPSGDNVLISNIHENNIKPAENKFLPNFDNTETNNFTNNPYQDNNNFNNSEPQNNFNNNFDIPTSLNNNMDAPLGSANTFTDFNALNQPMTNNYMPNDNQGNLFNQPLNIVDVPETKKEEIKEEAFDNPFDDAYENILFAKPVPVNPQSTQTETPAPQESNDSNSDNDDDNSENYISIDHQRTLFSTRDAVLELKKTTDRIKADGINLDSEEIDFDDYYQIIIKIKK